MEAEADPIKAEGTSGRQLQGPLVTLLALFIVVSVCIPDFRSPGNLVNIPKQVSAEGVLSIGMAFVILSGGIDLSVGSTVAVASMLAAKLSGQFALATILVPILAGVAIGAVNGALVTRLRIPPFIATLAMMLGVRGLAFIMAGKEAVVVGVSGGWFSQINRGDVLGIPFFR